MRKSDEIEYLPTPEQIRETCREIQQGWSEHDWKHRATTTIQRVEWKVPGVKDHSGKR